MAKYGRGLNIEFVAAVKNGEINEPFCTKDVRDFAKNRGWNPSEKYIAVLLPNGASDEHSQTYKKLFVSIGNGLYILSDLAKKEM
ncbi:hypothetical protein [Peptoclostridium acidaminophilum]|uniref:hypothetical protein n=1 Tax=Peptoclostridium acidaminophilum TaxID=1731 RepID=UPI00046D5F4C|nr:hypothetical protein [Peptoclostridium acidaminophilum]